MKIIIANWKMNNSFDYSEYWIEKVRENLNNTKYKIILSPPTIMIDHIDELLLDKELEKMEKMNTDIENISEAEIEKISLGIRDISIAGQDCHYRDSGAFTGDVSPKLLAEAGCQYVIIGHSERRKYHHESDKVILEKVKNALKNNLIPILCIGESDEIRSNLGHIEFIKNQLQNNLAHDININNIIIAYEPIWSIGTGKVPTDQQIAEISEYIKCYIGDNFPNIKNFNILYGGSVNENNAHIVNIPNIDGFLIGGASVLAEDFIKILKKI